MPVSKKRKHGSRKQKPPVRMDDKITREFRLPESDLDPTDTNNPNLTNDIQALFSAFQKKHPTDKKTAENLLNLHTAYMVELIQDGLALSLEQLERLDRIDLSELYANKSNTSTPIDEQMFLDAVMRVKTDEELFFACLPCFPKGALFVNKNRAQVFEILELDAEHYRAVIEVTDYITAMQPSAARGRSLRFELGLRQQKIGAVDYMLHMQDIFNGSMDPTSTTLDPNTCFGQKLIEQKSFTDLYTWLTPKRLRWNRIQTMFWEEVILKNSVRQDDRFYTVARMNPGVALMNQFLYQIMVSNYYLDSKRAVLLPETPLHETSNHLDDSTMNRTEPLDKIEKKTPTKRVRTVGKIRFISARPPKKPNQAVVRKYKLASWTSRGHIRHYKSGKTVYIKPQTKYRKSLRDQNKTPEPIQNIINIKPN